VYRLGMVPTARDGASVDHHNEIVTHYIDRLNRQ
jgi:hypothetical protein